MQIQNPNILQQLIAHQHELMLVKDFFDLKQLLKISANELESHINQPIYYTFEIQKKKGGTRSIQAPNPILRDIQKQLNYYLQAVYLLVKPAEVHGFIIKPKGFELNHSIISNANAHVNKKHLLNIDLQDFFPSISAKRVKEILVKHLKIENSDIASAIALLCTYKKVLPTGAPTSPVLANFACMEMDEELIRFCSLCNITYTRYADDLSFSSNQYFTSDVVKAIRTIIIKYQFKVNEKKFRLSSSKSKQSVTGITVNKKLNVDRTYIRNIRATLHHIQKEGLVAATKKHFSTRDTADDKQPDLMLKLKGQINFVGQVRGKDDEIYLKLLNIYHYNFLLIAIS